VQQDSFVALSGIAKRFGGVQALAGVDLGIAAGRMLSVVGHNGAGKSTLMQGLAGTLRPDAGSIRIGGRDVTWMPAAQRNVGLVFQSYALFPHMTVFDNVAFPLSIRRIGRAEIARRVEEALQLVRLEAYGPRKPSQLSGGQQQRVALARAIVFKPDILLLDEPLSALDAKIRHELRAELAHLLREFRITAVYVTHDQQEAMSLGDQVVVLHNGRVMQVGSPYEVYARPENDFVANFIGTANLYDARLENGPDGTQRVSIAFGELQIPGERIALAWPHLRAGPVRVVFRPQDVLPSSEAEAHTRVRIVEALFLGDRIRLAGTTPSGERMQLDVHNSLRIQHGDLLPVRINVEAVHLLAAANAT
jgi:ABC-type Fe3+/spermidine/putrescine transport system ATPase subunit